MASDDQFGYDMLVNNLPHLHTKHVHRLLSVGYDPELYYAQRIDAVAIPRSAKILDIYDHEPYRHLVIGDWDIFYYDTTDICRHVSIHIRYELGEDASPLDWAEVEAQR